MSKESWLNGKGLRDTIQGELPETKGITFNVNRLITRVKIAFWVADMQSSPSGLENPLPDGTTKEALLQKVRELIWEDTGKHIRPWDRDFYVILPSNIVGSPTRESIDYYDDLASRAT